MRVAGLQHRGLFLSLWIALLACSSIALADTTNNPHWTPDGCDTCHTGKPVPVPASTVTASCLKCHDGTHASDEAHPVERTLNAGMLNPGWPLIDGRIQCLTCHDIKQQCDVNAIRTEDNASFLRQPADAETPFCDNCHRDAKLARLNPHLMLDSGSHRPIEKKCTLCHEQTMDASTTVRTGDPHLRADQVTLCKSCHPHHKDISPTGHVSQVIPRSMLVYMRARELTGLLDSPSPDLIDQLTAENAVPQKMVPDSSGRVVCTTCHNPHQQGVFAPDCDLSDRSLRLVEGHLMTPTRAELFCRRCHKV